MTVYALGAVPSTIDERDHEIGRYFAVEVLPPKFLPPAYPCLNQGNEPACVGYSGALDTIIGVQVRDTYDGLDLYQITKKLDGNNYAGTSIRQCINARLNTGALADSGPEKGQREKITNYARLNVLTDIKTAIVGYRSAWIASDWPNSWFTPVAGILPPFGGGLAGGHAYEFVGYDDTFHCPDGSAGAFLMQNSWGSGWGSGGRAWFPYSYLTAAIGWEAWRTIPAPIGDNGNMRQFGFLGSPIGTILVDSASNTAALPVDGSNSITGIAGKTFTVFDHIAFSVPVVPAPNSTNAYLCIVGGQVCAVLDRNCTFTPVAAPVAGGTFAITGTVGGPNAAVTWTK